MTQDTEIIADASALGQIERAQIDMQIATARRYPRQLSLVKQRMLSFATLDEETAAGCFYTLPGRKGGDGKPLQGPSVRLAEIALSCYQHLRAGSRIIADDGSFITAQGVVHDLENNVVISIEVKRRVTTRDGKRYGDDMIATTGNAACSIALRNAAFRVIPMALVKPVYEAAKKLAIGNSKSLVQRRAASVEHFAKLGVPKEKVCEALGVRSVDDIQLDHLETLIGYATAIKDGDVSVDDVFKARHESAGKAVGDSNPFDKFPDKVPTEPEPVSTAKNGMKGEAKEEPKAEEVPDAQPEPAGDGRIHAFYEGCSVQSSAAGAEKPWKRWRVKFTRAGGEGIEEAVTCSGSIGAIVDSLEGGEAITLELTEGKKGAVVASLEIASDGKELALS